MERERIQLRNESRTIIIWLIVIFLTISQGLNVLSNSGINNEPEPIIIDNYDGNCTAFWPLENPDNYTLSSINLKEGNATLKLYEISIFENPVNGFANGSFEDCELVGTQGVVLDLTKNHYTLIADTENNRVVELDYDSWFWQYGLNSTSGHNLNELDDPKFALRSGRNKTLITDAKNNRVIEVGRNSEFYWQFGSNTTSGQGDDLLLKPSSAVPMNNDNILIADKDNDYVIEVNRNKQRVWHYGNNETDPGSSDLKLPTFAIELTNGNILITDHGNHRVIEVDKAGTLLWEYGTGTAGSGPNRLDLPTTAVRLDNGHTLIADTKNHRVIEVTVSRNIVWEYGQPSNPGYGPDQLNDPTCAIRLSNGNTLITDSDNHRVIEVDNGKTWIWQYGTNGTSGVGDNYLDYPNSALRYRKDKIVGIFTSQILDAGAETNWTTINWEEGKPPGTVILLYTRTGNTQNPSSGQWSGWSSAYRESSGENITSPANKYIQYTAVLVTFDLEVTPRFKSVTINGSRFEQQGELMTEFFVPNGLLGWNSFQWSGKKNSQYLQPYYNTGSVSVWHNVPANGNLKNVPIETGMIRFKFDFSTSNISVSPELYNFSLIYECLGPLFNIIVTPNPGVVVAGEQLEFIAKGFDAYGRELIIDPTWSTNVGVMSENMLNAQTNAGTGFVNATVDGLIGSAVVEIVPGSLDHIIVRPNEVVVIASEIQEFNATGYDKYENIVHIEPEWKTDVGEMKGNLFLAQMFAGRGTVKAMVSDITGFADVTVELNSTTHHPPKILSRVPDQLKLEDSEPWILDLAAYEWDDEDEGDKLFWYLTDFNESLYTVTGSYSKNDELTFIPKPNAYGNDNAILWLVDSDNMTVSQQLWVNITPVNDKPVIEALPDIAVHYEEPYTFDYSNYIYDIDNPKRDLLLSVQEPIGQKFTSVVGFNITYNYPQSMFGESVKLTIRVSDGNAFAERTFFVSITDNHAPILIKPFPDIEIPEGESKQYIFNLNEHFMDPDSDPLSYFFNAQHLAVNIHENNSVSISSSGSWFGTEIIVFRAMDPYGGMAEGNAKIHVLEINNPPEILPIPDLFVHYDYNYKFDVSKYISDPDNETSELSIWTSDLDHIRFDDSENTLMILNYPESLVGAKFSIMLNVSDGLGMVWTLFWVHVTDNYPPMLMKNMVDVYFKEDTEILNAIDLLEYFSDEDDDVLEISYNLLDEENITLVLNSDYSIDFSSKENWYGSSYVSFRAEDASKAFVEAGIYVVVIPVNDPPIANPIPDQNGKVGERWILDLTEYIEDIDNNVSELEIIMDSDLVTLSGRQLTIYGDKSINTNIEFIVTDGFQNTTGSFNLKISEPKQPKSENVSQLVSILLIIIVLIIIIMLIGIIRRRRGNFIITDAFVIHKSGILIKYLGDTLKEDTDEDIISGMLTAVQSFISDSFAGSADDEISDWNLNQMKMGKHEIMIERGKEIFITVIYKGHPGRRLSKLLRQTITKVENKYGSILENWKGNYSRLAGIEDIISPIITSNKSTKKTTQKTIELPKKSIEQPPQLPPGDITQPTPQLPPHQASHVITNELPQKQPIQPSQEYYPQTPVHISSQNAVQNQQPNNSEANDINKTMQSDF